MSERNVFVHTGGSAIIDIIAIIIGAVYSGTFCVYPTISFDLGKWLLYGGIGNLVACFLLGFVAVLSFSDSIKIALAKILFCIAWFIVGVMIISQVSPDCAKFNYTVYVMAIIYLVFLALWSLTSKFVIKNGGNSSKITV